MAIYALCFENQKSFAKYYFEGVIKLFVQINICITNFGFILTKIYVNFIYKYWHYNLCYCYFEEKKIIIISIYLRCCKFPKRYSSNSFNIID